MTGNKTRLTDHSLTGLIAGLTKDKIREIMVQMTVFAGFPTAINVLMTASEVFVIWDEKCRDGNKFFVKGTCFF